MTRPSSLRWLAGSHRTAGAIGRLGDRIRRETSTFALTISQASQSR